MTHPTAHDMELLWSSSDWQRFLDEMDAEELLLRQRQRIAIRRALPPSRLEWILVCCLMLAMSTGVGWGIYCIWRLIH